MVGRPGDRLHHRHGEAAMTALRGAQRLDGLAVGVEEGALAKPARHPAAGPVEERSNLGGREEHLPGISRLRSSLSQSGLNLGTQRMHTGGGHRRVVEGVDGPYLIAQRGVDLVDTALVRAGLKIRTDQQVESVTLQRESEPAQVTLSAQVLMPPGHPDARAGGQRVTQGRDDGVDIGEIVMLGGRSNREGKGSGNNGTVLGRLLREHVQALVHINIRKNHDVKSGAEVGHALSCRQWLVSLLASAPIDCRGRLAEYKTFLTFFARSGTVSTMGNKGIPKDTATRVTPGSDKKLPEAPRQILAVDTALLTIDLKRQQLLVVESQRTDTGKWVLPGTFVYGRETLADAVERCLATKLNVHGIHPHRLDVLDDPDRDDRERVISVAHVAVVRRDKLESIGEAEYPTRLVPVDRPGELMWDHPEIARLAKRYVRSRYQAAPDPEEFLDGDFTLPELQQVHEAVAGDSLDTFKFRRKMKDLVEGTGSQKPLAPGTLGRPAELFRRKPDRW